MLTTTSMPDGVAVLHPEANIAWAGIFMSDKEFLSELPAVVPCESETSQTNEWTNAGNYLKDGTLLVGGLQTTFAISNSTQSRNCPGHNSTESFALPEASILRYEH
jgi:hypothetical protein